ncbi:hypothetical protein D1872_201560 [compost metagenome]
MSDLRFTKKKAQEFFKALTGSSSNIEKESFARNSFTQRHGMMCYRAWILDGRIYCQIDLTNECIFSAYFNFDTYEYDMEYTEHARENDDWN